jgi:hypothetical protein
MISPEFGTGLASIGLSWSSLPRLCLMLGLNREVQCDPLDWLSRCYIAPQEPRSRKEERYAWATPEAACDLEWTAELGSYVEPSFTF